MTARLQLGARAQAIIVLALVATLGALIGVLADRAVAQRSDTAALAPPARPDFPRTPLGGPAGPRRGAGGEPRYGQRLFALLELTTDQRATIDSIMMAQGARVRELNRQLEPQVRAIAEQTHRSVEAVLTDAQRAQLRALRAERMNMMRQERQRRMQELAPRRLPADSGPRRP